MTILTRTSRSSHGDAEPFWGSKETLTLPAEWSYMKGEEIHKKKQNNSMKQLLVLGTGIIGVYWKTCYLE